MCKLAATHSTIEVYEFNIYGSTLVSRRSADKLQKRCPTGWRDISVYEYCKQCLSTFRRADDWCLESLRKSRHHFHPLRSFTTKLMKVYL